MLSISSSSPWQPLLVFNKLIYINNLRGCFWHLHCVSIPTKWESALPWQKTLLSTVRDQRQMDTCTRTRVQTYTHVVLGAAVAAVVPPTTGWCTLSLFWITAAQPIREQSLRATPIALSHRVQRFPTLQEWGTSWQRAPCSPTSSFSHFNSSANWLMIEPIKGDFKIALSSLQWVIYCQWCYN